MGTLALIGRRRRSLGLMPFDAALAALGDGGSMGHRTADIALDQVVGSVGRHVDFDADFRPRGRHLEERLGRVRRAVEAGESLPPIEVVELGELYFVADGHHRVAVARELGQAVVTARIRRICTAAYGMACLRLQHLRSKAAEKSFLDRVPLPDEVRRDLWLDQPSDWMRMADAAEAWGFERVLTHGRPMDRATLATTWWHDEVARVLESVRATGVGLDLRDVELFATALAVRDSVGALEWPTDLCDRVGAALAG